ncbi:MAG: hypothetical protein AAF907_13090, partial [Planctomycetota bacterium]
MRFETDAITRRFVTTAHPDRAPVNAAGFLTPVSDGGTVGNVSADDPSYVPPFDLGIDREPLWRIGLGDTAGMTEEAAYANSYPADPDNDGIFDAIWLDLDFPIQEAGDGASQYVPLWAVKIVDADALFNLNAHGNSYGSYADADRNGVDDSLTLDASSNSFVGPGGAPMISQSHQGRTPAEVNPQWGLSGHDTAVAGATADEVEAFSQFFDGFGVGMNWVGGPRQSRNLEWWFLLHGRADFKDDPRSGSRVPDRLLVGRYGESERLEAGMQEVARANPSAAAFFPYPGLSANSLNADGAADDNFNALEGMGRPMPGLVYGGVQGFSANGFPMVALADGVPADLRGSGDSVDALRGLRRLFLADLNGTANVLNTPDEEGNVRFRFPSYMNAVLPLFPAGGGAADGFSNVGVFQVIRDWFATTGLVEGRTFTASAQTPAVDASGAPIAGAATLALTGRGAPGGTLAEPASGATGAVTDGAPLPAGA